MCLISDKFADMKAITLYVGEAQRAFYIHEDILFQSSGFFKTAFESNFREGSQRTMTLPDDKVEVFEDLVNWLYSQKYLIPSLTDRKKQKEAIDASLMLFVASDKFDCPGLKTTICQQLLVMAKNGKPQPHPIAIEEMYTKIPVNSGMRKILTTWYTMLQPSWYENEFVRSWLSKSPDLALDLMAALAGRLSTAAAFKWKADSEYID